MRRFTILSLALGLVLMLVAAFRSTAESDARQENRFLVVIDTSAPMEKKAPTVQKVVAELISTGMRGLVRDGDTIGVWTFNDQLHTEFPMQVWSDSGKQAIVDAVASFVRSLKYGKKARFDRVLPSMYSIIKGSQTLTVILVTDGTEQMQGGRFDKEINNLHKEFQKPLNDAAQPFVTVLASRNGEIMEYAVSSGIGPIQIPDAVDPTNRVEMAKVAAAARASATNTAPVPPPRKREPRHLVIGPSKNTNQVASADTGKTNASPVPAPDTTAAASAPAPVTVPDTISSSKDTNSPTGIASVPDNVDSATATNPIPVPPSNSPAADPAPSVVSHPADPAPQIAVTPAQKSAVSTPAESTSPAETNVAADSAPKAGDASKSSDTPKTSDVARSSLVSGTNRVGGNSQAAAPQLHQKTALGGSYYSNMLLLVSLGFLVLGIGMVCFIVWHLRRRRKHPSIISQSIKRSSDFPQE
jgi:hypothetical protein